MPAPAKIVDLIERFERNIESYKSGGYTETEVRREFIDPFFKELGWDIDNTEGYAELYKDVVHEDAIKIGKSTKAPDYSFRIGGQRKFFLEAKKPLVNIKDDIDPSFQLRRYAWTAKLPLSILTDFEEFAVFDTRIKPNKGDKPGKGRIFYCTYKQYIEKWDEIAAIFSKSAILQGAFDKYAAKGKKRGTEEVDDEFLKEIERWRELLAKNIALRNDVTQRQLNFAVQSIIDRIVFLRICEDRGIEDEEQLKKAVQAKNGIYDALKRLFLKADDRYNSGLFHFKKEKNRASLPDEFTPGLIIDDKPLKEIINHLYYPESPYEFSVLPADILGQVYEQFLGKVIELKGRSAVIEEKPEVKKAGGVFYTPTYVVDYIIENTLGELVKKKDPEAAAKLRILDPACGSGSFLIQTYQYLLDWHLKWYLQDKEKRLKERIKGEQKGKVKGQKAPKQYHIDELIETQNGWQLTYKERLRILTNNIYGVDIDAQAVEVTKLSLLLKLLEVQNHQLPTTQRVLPDLDTNIKCGNSLIGSDYYEGQQLNLLGNVDLLQVNPFDWNSQFPSVFRDGGFDVVLGNPPYFNMDDTWGKNDPRQKYIKDTYSSVYNDKTDILFYFLNKGVLLAKDSTSFIVSRAFLEAYKADKLREWLANNGTISEIIDFRNYFVFDKAKITTAIVKINKNKKTDADVYHLMANELFPKHLGLTKNDLGKFKHFKVKRSFFGKDNWIFSDDLTTKINNKVDTAGVPVGDILHIGQGMQTGENSIFGKNSESDVQGWSLNPTVRQRILLTRARNSDIHQFFIEDSGEYLLYLEDFETFSALPRTIQNYLNTNKAALKARAACQRGNCDWWKYTWPLHKEHFHGPKIYCPYIASLNRFAIDLENRFLGLTDTTVLYDNDQPESLFYILGILNSDLMTFRFKFIGKLKSKGSYEYFENSVSKIPIKRINLKNSKEKEMHDSISEISQFITGRIQQHKAANVSAEKNALGRQIESAFSRLNTYVYQIYGLTPEEIEFVKKYNLETTVTAQKKAKH